MRIEKRIFATLFCLLCSLFLVGCTAIQDVVANVKNKIFPPKYEYFYGVVQTLYSTEEKVIHCPKTGDFVVPKNNGIFAWDEDGRIENYALQVGDLVRITFVLPKDAGGVQMLLSYPAQIAQTAERIEVLAHGVEWQQEEDGYYFSFDMENTFFTSTEADMLKGMHVGERLYFIQTGGKNGVAYQRLICESEVVRNEGGRMTVKLPKTEEVIENFLTYLTGNMMVAKQWEY